MATATTSAQSGKTGKAENEDSSRLTSLKNNVSYLAYGSAAGAAVPASFKTRTVLKTTRYVLKYIFYRLIRYAKYVVISEISSLLHLSPTATQPIASSGLTSSATSRRSFFSSAGERAQQGHDARLDEHADQASLMNH
ncbi:hypothetical protein QFC19_008482 [Naganishia cerealis]|uniref:Uncharacterized protein n=1 Tax=Naganishia cerealis TaxID=610337 RepID=A0ACC2V1S6_9TREE|nr:hypothetical protein QFC19_008482 [Naganishia cerealis]